MIKITIRHYNIRTSFTGFHTNKVAERDKISPVIYKKGVSVFTPVLYTLFSVTFAIGVIPDIEMGLRYIVQATAPKQNALLAI